MQESEKSVFKFQLLYIKSVWFEASISVFSTTKWIFQYITRRVIIANNETLISAQRKDKSNYCYIFYLRVCNYMPLVALLSQSTAHHKFLLVDCNTLYHWGPNIVSPDILYLVIGLNTQNIIYPSRSCTNQYLLPFPSVFSWKNALMKWIYVPSWTCSTYFHYYDFVQETFFTQNIYSLFFYVHKKFCPSFRI